MYNVTRGLVNSTVRLKITTNRENKMVKLIKYLLLAICIFLSTFVKAAAVDPLGINYSIQANNEYLITTYGNFESNGFILNSSSISSIGTSHIINFQISSPTELQLALEAPFSYTSNIGLLNTGEHFFTSNFYVDGILDNTISDSYILSSVPLPAATWLFISGFISLLIASTKLRDA